MLIEYDPVKDRGNQEKHGISLAAAKDIEWDTALEVRDERKNYGEVRYKTLGFIEDRLYCVVYVNRAEKKRIISLRRANDREFKQYEDHS